MDEMKVVLELDIEWGTYERQKKLKLEKKLSHEKVSEIADKAIADHCELLERGGEGG